VRVLLHSLLESDIYRFPRTSWKIVYCGERPGWFDYNSLFCILNRFEGNKEMNYDLHYL
jgi:hypothetical protein